MTSAAVAALVVAVLLVPAGGVVAAVDAALAFVSVARSEELLRENRRGARSLLAVARQRARHTNLLLLLRLVCELLATVLVTVVAVATFGGAWWILVVTSLVMVVVSYVFVGVGPRTLGRQHPYAIALRTAFVVRVLGVLLGPLASLLILFGNAVTPGKGLKDGPFSSEVELRELVDLAEASGVVEEAEREMIQSVFTLGDTVAREVMVPRPEVVWIGRDLSVEQALSVALRSGFSRLPVIGENADDVVGVAYLKDLARIAQEDGSTGRVDASMRAAAYVPESKILDSLLREMQASRRHVAIVVDEYGGTAGILTIEDILEEIVGEITDEYDDERPPVEWLDDGSARVTSRLSVEDLEELFDVEIPEKEEIETVGGLLADALGVVPIPGAEADVRGLRLVASGAAGRRNRIDSVVVSRVPDQGAVTDTDDPPAGDVHEDGTGNDRTTSEGTVGARG